MLVVLALKQPAIECLTLYLTRRMNGVILSYCSLGTIRPEDSRAAFEQQTCLGLNHLDMPRTSY